MKLEFTIKEKIWLYEGEAAWQFITINKTLSKQIRGIVKGLMKGPSLKVKATIGSYTWQTSIFSNKDGTFVLPIKKEVRNATGLDAGKIATVSFYLIGY
jgi:hypothetical protein